MKTAGTTRPTRHALDLFFDPGTVAIIGATERRNSVGAALVANLRHFRGPVFAINPNHDAVGGLRTYRSISDVPAHVDLAVIATPAHTVPGIMAECAQAGVRAAIVISAGFRECGHEGAILERRVLEEARLGGIRVLGPNCLGIMAPHVGLNATFAAGLAIPGSVAFVSQSGALCTAVLDWSLREKVGFSAFVSIGAMADVGWSDLIDWLSDDPNTKSILLYIESIGDARGFLSAAREAAFSKPIIAVKVGRSEAAASAAASHTGALTGSDDVLDAAFRRAGVLRVDSIEELFDLAEVLAKQPRPRDRRLAIVTNAGGPGALAVDRLVLRGGLPAKLSGWTMSQLDDLLPPQWSRGNPVDILGDAGADRYAKATELVVRDPGVDGILVVLTPQAMTDPRATAERLTTLAAFAPGKPILASWMGGGSIAAGETILNEAGIPTFRYPDRAAQAFAYMSQYSANLQALYETPSHSENSTPSARLDLDPGAVIKGARAENRVLLTETESKQILSAYGIPVVGTFVASTEDEAAAIAAKLGFPVAIKLHSLAITHKAEAGGVVLNVGNVAGVRKAWKSIRRAVTEKADAGAFLGVAVQRMIESDGMELLLGSSTDPQFGPVIVFGAGGRMVEVMKDRAIGLPPLTSTLARRLMERTRINAALTQANGRPAVDLAALEQTVVRFSQLVAEQRWIKEIDVNPLLAAGSEIMALDARIILHPADTREEDLPRPSIRPYPREYSSSWVLKDGAPLQIRPIRPEDEPLMVRFHESLSAETVYSRYFTHLSLNQRTTHHRLSRLCFVDYDREIALVAVADRAGTDRAGPSIVGVGRLCRSRGKPEAEFAVLVADEWQGRGLGTRLLSLLVDVGRREGLKRIFGAILAENHDMRDVCERVGFIVDKVPGESELEASIEL